MQFCIVYMARHSLNYVSWKLCKEVAADLRAIYTAAMIEAAEQRLDEFEAKWGEAYPPIVRYWRSNWVRLTRSSTYPPEIMPWS